MYDGDESEGPKGTFEIYKAEADSLFKQGEYKKSIDSYTIALELQPGDKNCLVCRSKCYLQLGDTQNALVDAEASLSEDKTFHKGVYQKAQALYYQGDFEMSLVFYHRGHKLRPELQEFRLGIQKAQEAIDNSVGAPDKVQLTTEGDLSFFAKQDDKKIKKPTYNTYGRPGMQTQKKLEISRPAGNEKTIKQLLGELYGDRQYLEKLLKETDPNTPVGKTISGLVSQGLNYLDTRTDFWRQQKPMYARKHEKQMMRRDNRTEQSSTGKLSPNDYIIRELE
ncbi:outer dynein arm-docking complex subunit 4-like, partial [Saccostrea cucullata]|uniref:outer dynein arm-docking complex subunit 4-like n=1 Tax=Saccostrea cuccullata TaxID=36930 RepID=UPI002ED52F49